MDDESGESMEPIEEVPLIQLGEAELETKKYTPTQPFLFLLQDSLYGFPILFTVTSEHIRLFTF